MQPVISWYEDNNVDIISKWDIGIIDAGTTSPEKTILIWNNRGGESAISDMQDAKITTTDGAGDTMDVITGKWVSCRVDSITGDGFTEIGGVDGKIINAKDQTSGTIKGTENSAHIDDTANYTKVTLKATPPLNAPAGKRSFRTRVSYYYT